MGSVVLTHCVAPHINDTVHEVNIAALLLTKIANSVLHGLTTQSRNKRVKERVTYRCTGMPVINLMRNIAQLFGYDSFNLG